MKKLLKKLKIVQTVSNDQRHKDGLKRLGQGYCNAYRLNPFNPLSYIALVFAIFIVLIMHGVVGVYEKIGNPFKWN